MEKNKYKIMDALMLPQQEATNNVNYGQAAEDAEYERIAKESDKDVEDIKKNPSPQQVGFEKKPINIEGVQSEPEQREPLIPQIRDDVQPPSSKVQEIQDHISPPDTIEFAQEQVLEQGTNEAVDKLSSFTDDYPNFWVGAAPLLMGALVGDIGAGAEQGGEALMQRYKDERDAAKASLKSRSTASKVGPLKQIYDPATRKSYWGTEAEALGKQTGSATKDLGFQQGRSDIRVGAQIKKSTTLGSHLKYKEDKATGIMYEIDPVTKTQRAVFNPTGLNPVQKGQAKHAADSYNKVADKEISTIRDMEQGFDDLVVNNQLSNKLAVMRFIKQVETRLSDYDRLYYTQEISDLARGGERLRKVEGNTMNPRILKDAMGLVSRAITKSRRRLSDSRNTHSSQLVGADFPEDKAMGALGDLPKFYNLDFSKNATVKGPDGTYQIPWNEVPQALKQGYELNRE